MKQTAIKPCKTCALRGATNTGTPACSKFKIPIDDIENNGCTWHTTNTFTCEICGQPKDTVMIWQDGNTEKLICSDCYNLISSCHTCVNLNICNFRNDHSEPQMVSKTIQQGFMTMQTQVKNPRLVNKHCSTCRCSDINNNCFKDDTGAGCPNWQLR